MKRAVARGRLNRFPISTPGQEALSCGKEFHNAMMQQLLKHVALHTPQLSYLESLVTSQDAKKIFKNYSELIFSSNKPGKEVILASFKVSSFSAIGEMCYYS